MSLLVAKTMTNETEHEHEANEALVNVAFTFFNYYPLVSYIFAYLGDIDNSSHGTMVNN